jgi:predicted RNA binding protein YcfA (HicA-like mRNA interferase family)
MTAREVLKILHKDGWYEVDQEGSHMQLKHPSKPGKVTVAIHGKRIYHREHATKYGSRRGFNSPIPATFL